MKSRSLPGTSGCPSWRSPACVHGWAGIQNRAQPHLVRSVVIIPPPLKPRSAEPLPASLQLCLSDSGTCWEGQCHLAFTGAGGEDAQFLLMTQQPLSLDQKQDQAMAVSPGPIAPSCGPNALYPIPTRPPSPTCHFQCPVVSQRRLLVEHWFSLGATPD